MDSIIHYRGFNINFHCSFLSKVSDDYVFIESNDKNDYRVLIRNLLSIKTLSKKPFSKLLREDYDNICCYVLSVLAASKTNIEGFANFNNTLIFCTNLCQFMMDRWFIFEGGPHREVIKKGSVTMAFCCFTVESLFNWFISTNRVFVFIPDKVNSWYNNIYKMKFQILKHCFCLHNRCYTNALLFGKTNKKLTYIYPKILELSQYNICEVYDQNFINSLKVLIYFMTTQIIEKQFYRNGLLRNCRESDTKNYAVFYNNK